MVMNFVRSQMSPNANIIYGVTVNSDDSDKLTASILGSGFQDV
jgi:cell division GTPase FtsZ